MSPKKYERVYYELKKHFSDCTANLAVSTPIAAGLETFFAGMSDDVSINARLISAIFSYVGVGSLVSRGRDFYKNIFHITDNTNEKTQTMHDAIYFVLANLLLAPPLYVFSGTKDVGEIVLGTLSCMAIGGTTGPVTGYAISSFRDFAGIERCGRLPKKIQNLKDKTKKGVLSLLILSSVLASFGIYSFTPDKKIEQENSPKVVYEQFFIPQKTLEDKLILID